MDHVVVPLDRDHVAAVDHLAAEVADLVGLATLEPWEPHVTVVSFGGLDRPTACAAMEAAAARTTPFRLRAHGYGVFAGNGAAGLSLHVPVVRGPALNDLHAAVHAELAAAGAEMAGWTTPDLWSPHITLVDHELEPAVVGAAVAELARRHHPSWNVPVDRLQLRGGWAERHHPCDEVALRRS